MPKTYEGKINELRESALLKRLLDQMADGLVDQLLDTCADQEYRLCLLELGIN